MKYIRIPSAQKKLKLADAEGLPVYVSAPTGWGKTVLLRNYYQRRSAIFLSGISGRLSDTPDPKSNSENVFIIDDINWVTDEESKRYVHELLDTPGVRVVMCGRGRFPRWLIQEAVDLDFMRIHQEDLAFGIEEARAFFQECSFFPDTTRIQAMVKACEGYPIALRFYAYHLQSGEEYGENLNARIWDDVCNYVSSKVYSSWPEDILALLLSLCEFEEFSTPMAVYISGMPDAQKLIHRCEDIGALIQLQKNGMWRLLPKAEMTLKWQKNHTFSPSRIRENYLKGACYFEQAGDTIRALEFYRKAEDRSSIYRLLLEASSNHPGVNRLCEMREFFFSLSDKEIKAEPTLISGMSMLASLTMKTAESEEWYNELKLYEKDKRNPVEKRREAHLRIAWLNMTLPHRYGKKLLEMLRSVCAMSAHRDITMPPVSVTSAMPSFLNGSLDFSEWSLHTPQLAASIGAPLEKILGAAGTGLVAVVKAETSFLRAESDAYTICENLNNGYEQAATNGTPQMCFAAAGVLVKQHLTSGQISAAKAAISTVRTRIDEACVTELTANFEAFNAWFALYTGDMATVNEYLQNSTDPHESFCVLDRYRAMVRLRCLIATNRFAEAGDLSTFLDGYFTSYRRTIYWIQNRLFRAVILYNEGSPLWIQLLSEALQQAEKYTFVRVISMEGHAVMPLLQQLKKSPVSGSFMRKVIDETSKMALLYPDYLRYIPKVDVRLTPRETQILGLLCGGVDMQSICRMCNISYSALKKHNSSIYRKLGATSRVEAERIANQMGLVHH